MTHFLFTHFSGFLQSLSPSQAGYLGFPPHANARNKEIQSSFRQFAMARTLVTLRPAGNIDSSSLAGPWRAPSRSGRASRPEPVAARAARSLVDQMC